MKVIKEAVTTLFMVALCLLAIVCVVGEVIEISDRHTITQTEGEGVRCYTYRESISCTPISE